MRTVKGVEELVNQFDAENYRSGYLSCVIALAYWFTVTKLEGIGDTIYLRPWMRKAIADFAYPLATLWWTGFSHIPGRIKDSDLLRVPITKAFYPTVDRPWLVPFWNLSAKWVFVSLPMGILMTLLFYYDHNVSSLTAQAKQFPLKKPAGFHWDFFLLGITCFIAGIVGLPLPNGLVPQAPVHTDSCTVYEDVLKVTKEKDDKRDAELKTHNKKIVRAVEVKEQRVSHFLMALALIGSMSGPILQVMHTVPRALFSGVFFVVGWGSCGPGNGIAANFLYIFQERRFTDPLEPRLSLNKGRIALYITFQMLGVVISVAISQTIGAIGFPVIIISLIPLRWVILPRIFTEHELLILDAPTADADVVLASMGGQPQRPEVRMAEEKRKQQHGDGEQGTSSGSATNNSSESGMRSREAFRDKEERDVDAQEAHLKEEEGVDRDGMHGIGQDRHGR